MTAEIVDLDEWKNKKREAQEQQEPRVIDNCMDINDIREIYLDDLDSAATEAAQEIIDTTHKYLTIVGKDKIRFDSETDRENHLKLWYWFSLSIKAIVYYNLGKSDHPHIQEILGRIVIDSDGLPALVTKRYWNDPA